MAKAAGASGLPEALKDPKVIGGIAAGVVVLAIIAIVLMMRPGPSEPTGSVDYSDVSNGAAAAPGGAMAGVNSDTPGQMPDAGAMAGMGGAMQGAGGAAMDPSLGGAVGLGGVPAAPAAQEPPRNQSPGVATRSNAFQENADLRKVIDSIQEVPENVAASHNLYAELNPPDQRQQISTDENEGPPVPPMRLVGVVFGRQLTGMLQMGSEYIQVTPGKMIPSENPIYRVQRLEPDKVVLTRRWEIGNRKGVQRIEVPLAESAAPPSMPVGGMGGAPGMMPGLGSGGPPGTPGTAIAQ